MLEAHERGRDHLEARAAVPDRGRIRCGGQPERQSERDWHASADHDATVASAAMASLEGKVAAITGASSGIGEATAVALAQAGARVSLGARRKDRLDSLVEQLGDRAVAIETDVSDEAQARGFIQKTKDEFGSVDILVNNAGVMLLGLC